MKFNSIQSSTYLALIIAMTSTSYARPADISGALGLQAKFNAQIDYEAHLQPSTTPCTLSSPPTPEPVEVEEAPPSTTPCSSTSPPTPEPVAVESPCTSTASPTPEPIPQYYPAEPAEPELVEEPCTSSIPEPEPSTEEDDCDESPPTTHGTPVPEVIPQNGYQNSEPATNPNTEPVKDTTTDPSVPVNAASSLVTVLALLSPLVILTL